jgi:regulator of protease activity HflC (stomatin/prohibitin superfamily)
MVSMAKGQFAKFGSGGFSLGVFVALAVFVVLATTVFYANFIVNVPRGHIAILIRRTGLDLSNSDEIAPTDQHKGIQKKYLTEGWQMMVPYYWDWEIIPMQEVPQGKIGVLISKTGDDLSYSEYLAKVDPTKEAIDERVLSKGVVPGYLLPGRYAINPYLFELELYDPIVIEAGYKGIVTDLNGPMPTTPNSLLSDPGFRGVQKNVLDAQTYYFNPYETRVELLNTRDITLSMEANKDMGFPSKDGFWIRVEGNVRFHVQPDRVAEVYVMFNDHQNGDSIEEEIANKVILPLARSFCRVEGSKFLGRDLVGGSDTADRSVFQEQFFQTLKERCKPLGINIMEVSIKNLYPPQPIAEQIRQRQMAVQIQETYKREITTQEAEKKKKAQDEKGNQEDSLGKTYQDIAKIMADANQKREVALTKVNERQAVAEFKLAAAKDEAEAIRSRGKAEADVIRFQNEADASGWKNAVIAFGGNGDEFSRYVLYQKMASSYRKIMANTADSPIMKIFETFEPTEKMPAKTVPVTDVGN